MLRFLFLFSFLLSHEALSNPLETAEQQSAKFGATIYTTPFFAKRTQELTPESFGSTTRIIGNTTTIKKHFNSHFTAGLDFTFRNQENTGDAIPFGFNQSTRVDQDRYQTGIFGEFSYKGITIKPGIRGGFDDYTLERPDLLTGLVGVSNTNGFNVGSSLEGSALIPLTKNIIVRPSINFDYSFFSTQDFTEEGAGPNNVAFQGVRDTRIEAEVGLGIGYVFKQDNDYQIAAFTSGKYKRNFKNGPIETSAALASGLLDLGDVTLLTAQEANGYIIDAGFIIDNGKGLEFTFFYEREAFPTSTENTFAGRLSISF